MTYTSVCSGIEAATAAWHPLGWKAKAYSEIEPFPAAVLAHHYPDTPNLGDMTKLKELPHERVAADVLVGGTPCQSFSVAGLRGGLEDPRGNLMLEFGSIAARFRFPWLLWENVPGVLSSAGGRDFAAFLGLLTGRSVSPPGEGGWGNSGILAGIGSAYGVAWCVLDAQYFGVPQRRRRVFVVGYLGDWRRAAAVLFDGESLRGNSPPSRAAREDVTGTLAARSGAGGGLGTDFDLGGGLQVSGTLSANGKAAGSATQQDAEAGLLVLDARGNGNGNGNDVNTLTGDHASRPTDYTPLIFNARQDPIFGDVSMPVDTDGSTLAVAFALRGREGGAMPELEGDHVGALRAASGGSSRAYIALPFDTTQITSPANRSNPKEGDPMHPLAAHAHAHVPAMALSLLAHAPRIDSETQTLIAQSVPVLIDQGGGVMNVENDKTGTLRRETKGHEPVIFPASGVRRLTPVECERLQGFLDNFTRIPWRGKQAEDCPDGPRYKAVGNSMAVPVMRWIGERIELEENRQ